MRRRVSRPRRTQQTIPVNNLGSKESTPTKTIGKPKRLASLTSPRKLYHDVESDKHLILGPSPNSKLNSNDKWSTEAQDVAVKKITARVIQDSSVDNGKSSPTAAFSDVDENEISVRYQKVLRLSEYFTGIDPTDYDSILIPCEKVVLGRTSEVFHNISSLQTLKNIHVKLYTDLSRMIISEDKNVLVDLNIVKDISRLDISDQTVLFWFKSNLLIHHKLQDRAAIYLSGPNTRKFKNCWIKLILEQDQSQLDPRSRSRKDLDNDLKEDSLIGKSYGSLQKNSRKLLKLRPSTAISTPVTPSATKPRDFYLPKTTPRITRSVTKESSPTLTIYDYDTPKSSSRFTKRQTFKPSLKYTFDDNSVFKIRNVDFSCLYGSEWINDTIIDFFIKYFTEKMVKEGNLESSEYHVLSTFFFTKLKSSKNHYQNIQRWVSKLDLLRKKFIVMPINEALHWYCSIIYNLDALVDPSIEKGVCTVYVFDSLAQKHHDILKPIQDFIIGYAKDIYSKDIDPDQIQLKISRVPKQPNFNDCGIHVIYNVQKFLENREKCLNLWNKDTLSVHELSSVFVRNERDRMRYNLRAILKDLQKSQIETGVVSEDEGAVEEGEEDDDDDIVYIDAEEFHSKKPSDSDSKETSNKVSEDESDGIDDIDQAERELEDEKHNKKSSADVEDEIVNDVKSSQQERYFNSDSDVENVTLFHISDNESTTEKAISGEGEEDDKSQGLQDSEELKSPTVEPTSDIGDAETDDVREMIISSSTKTDERDGIQDQNFLPNVSSPIELSGVEILSSSFTHERLKDVKEASEEITNNNESKENDVTVINSGILSSEKPETSNVNEDSEFEEIENSDQPIKAVVQSVEYIDSNESDTEKASIPKRRRLMGKP